MNLPEEEDFITRRNKLAGEIARQRGDLMDAYRQLEAPIRYTERGMRVFGFIQQNPWVVTAVPAVFSLFFSLFGGKKKSSVVSSAESPAPARGKFGKVTQVVSSGVNNGIRLYQLYRRVRSFLP